MRFRDLYYYKKIAKIVSTPIFALKELQKEGKEKEKYLFSVFLENFPFQLPSQFPYLRIEKNDSILKVFGTRKMILKFLKEIKKSQKT